MGFFSKKTFGIIKGFVELFKMVKSDDKIKHLPLYDYGLNNVPAFPISLKHTIETLKNLSNRNKELQQAKHGLTKKFTIQGHTENAYTFAFGRQGRNPKQEAIDDHLVEFNKDRLLAFKLLDFTKNRIDKDDLKVTLEEPLTKLPLDAPDQFALSWTTFNNINRDATKNLLRKWSESISDWESATKQFFPIISSYGSAYNLLLLQKVTPQNITSYKSDFSKDWTAEMDTLAEKNLLYVIDLRIYEILEPQEVKGTVRFTPSTFTWLKQDAVTKEITPFAVHVSGSNESGSENSEFYDIHSSHKQAWIYALQAAKTSVTVYGIWLGHVYHWHLVTASMIMSMTNTLSIENPVYKILAPQSNYLIGFDNVLLILWRAAAPPTSIKTARQFLKLINAFGKGRKFFDDDPLSEIKSLGLKKEDFTVSKDWDMYPIVGYLLSVWGIVEKYVDTYVNINFPADTDVENNKELQLWMVEAEGDEDGNIKGLPVMKSKKALKDVLNSILYRITVHGIARADNTLNPGLTFVGNFPPCLQKSDIPDPSKPLPIKELMEYLPKTGTIGEMITFYFTFVYSAPYEPIIPLTGVNDNLFFEGDENSEMNKALIEFRKDMIAFMQTYNAANKIPNQEANSVQIHQWPLNVET